MRCEMCQTQEAAERCKRGRRRRGSWTSSTTCPWRSGPTYQGRDARPGPGFVGWHRTTMQAMRKDEPRFLCGPPPAAWPARLDVSERRRLHTGPVHGEALASGVRTKMTGNGNTSSQDPRASGTKKESVPGLVLWGLGCCCSGWGLGGPPGSQGLDREQPCESQCMLHGSRRASIIDHAELGRWWAAFSGLGWRRLG